MNKLSILVHKLSQEVERIVYSSFYFAMNFKTSVNHYIMKSELYLDEDN